MTLFLKTRMGFCISLIGKPDRRLPTEDQRRCRLSSHLLLWLREKGEKLTFAGYERIKLAEVYLHLFTEFGGTPTEQT